MPRPHLMLLGGFLGAGKTSAVRALASYLTEQGIRIAVITNDQGSGLVDTAITRACGLETTEIAGGCFCCRFDELIDASNRFIDRLHPDALIAEAVGSCTDLAATVTYPLRRIYGDTFTIAPLSVIVDPLLALAVLGVEGESSFSPNVEYIYRRQLEEADVIVVNKRDLLSASQLAALDEALARAAPEAERFAVSIRNGDGLDPWLRHVTFGEQRRRTPMVVDYDRYADGEAGLGWLNATVKVDASPPVEASELLGQVAGAVARTLSAARVPVAHLKMSLHSDSSTRTATIHLVNGGVVPELGLRSDTPVGNGRLIVNLRAEGEPEALEGALAAGLIAAAGPALRLTVEHREVFRPGRPVPTHRDGAAV